MEDRLINRFGKDPGWSVPEGYFESFRAEISEKLPEYKMPAEAAPLSVWQRVKPYLYLAAMFAGIWLMMKVFYTTSQNAVMNLDNPPEHIAMLMASDPDYDLYGDEIYSSSDEDYDAMIGTYDNMYQLEKDLGLTLKPAYRNMKLN